MRGVVVVLSSLLVDKDDLKVVSEYIVGELIDFMLPNFEMALKTRCGTVAEAPLFIKLDSVKFLITVFLLVVVAGLVVEGLVAGIRLGMVTIIIGFGAAVLLIINLVSVRGFISVLSVVVVIRRAVVA